MRCLKIFIAILILASGAFLAYIYSGVANVAATSSDSIVARWVLGTLRERSIATHISNIQVPSLTDPKMIDDGFMHYQEDCADCHLAPGIETSGLRAGLNPRPPVLARTVPHSTPAELFWITKNGIKMTAMPAWGQTHDDATLWAIVAFLEKLPSITPTEYQVMKQAIKQSGSDSNK
ncbi:MAG: cytochrome c [Gammaproteobacteria bacterium]